MATFTIHRIHVFVPAVNYWVDDSDYYNPVSHCDDIWNVFIVFGHDSAWNLYRKQVALIRHDYASCEWKVTIERALVPEGGLIFGSKGDYPGSGFEPLKELKWELLDATTGKNIKGGDK